MCAENRETGKKMPFRTSLPAFWHTLYGAPKESHTINSHKRKTKRLCWNTTLGNTDYFVRNKQGPRGGGERKRSRQICQTCVRLCGHACYMRSMCAGRVDALKAVRSKQIDFAVRSNTEQIIAACCVKTLVCEKPSAAMKIS